MSNKNANVENRNILILEDDASIREPMVRMLERNGMNVTAFESILSARAAIPELPEISVAILDNELPDDTRMYHGLEIGRLLRKKFGYRAPFLLVYSGHQKTDYFRNALNLGVVAYLAKGKEDGSDVVLYARTLAALWNATHVIPDKEQFIEGCRSEADAMLSWCQTVLIECLQSVFPKIKLCPAKVSGPDLDDNPNHATIWHENGWDCLELQLQSGEETEEAKKLMQILDQQAFKTLHGTLNMISRSWLEDRTRKEEFLVATNHVCRMIGQELESFLRRLDRSQKLPDLRRLDEIAASLTDAGFLLQEILKPQQGTGHSSSRFSSEMGLLCQELSERFAIADKAFKVASMLENHLDQTPLSSSDFKTVFSELMGWMIQLGKDADDIDFSLSIKAAPYGSVPGVQITLEDNNERLPDKIREEYLQKPFFLPIEAGVNPLGFYLAKTLIEKAGGNFKDCSDHIEGGIGHRFVITFPKPLAGSVL